MSILEKYYSATDKESELRHEVSEILRAYRHPWDVFSESLQNAVDAINTAYRSSHDPEYYQYDPNLASLITEDYKGQIRVSLNTQANTIKIQDNGIGIRKEDLDSFVLPKGTGKKRGHDYGFKGYGLTFLAFISDEIEIISRHITQKHGARLKITGCFAWVCGTSSFPVEELNDDETAYGTSITIKLADNYASNFEAIASLDTLKSSISSTEDIGKLAFILRTKTALGNTRHLFKTTPTVPIDALLDVIDSEGSKDDNVKYSFYHPRQHDEVRHSSYDFEEYITNLKSSSFERKFRTLNHSIQDIEIGTVKSKKFRINIAFCAISKTRLGNIIKELGFDEELDKSTFGFRPGIHLSINGMPTGIAIDDWHTKGSKFQRYFVVVDADLSMNNQLDPGRKGISEHYADLITNKVESLLNTIKAEAGSDPFSRYVIKDMDVGRKKNEEDDDEDLSLETMLDEVEQRASSYSDEERLIVEKLQRLTSFSGLPTTENESIALFYELLGKNIIKGYRTLMISGIATYDGLFDVKLKAVPSNLHEEDILGVAVEKANNWTSRGHEYISLPRSKSALCIEFKRNIGAFLKELKGRTDKEPETIDILICWDDTGLVQCGGTVKLSSIHPNQRRYHGVTHRLSLQGYEGNHHDIECILLKNVIDLMP